MKNMSFTARITLGFGAMIILIALMTVIGWVGVNHQYQSVKTMMDSDITVSTAIGDVRYQVGNLRRYEKDSFLNASDASKVSEYHEKWNQSRSSAEASLAKARAAADKPVQDRIDSLLDKMKHYGEGYESIAARLGKDLTTPADANHAMEQFKEYVHSMEGEMTDLENLTETRARGVAADLATTRADTLKSLFGLAAVALLVAIVIAAGVAMSIRIPLQVAEQAAARIAAANDLTTKLPNAGQNEVGRTIDAFGRVLEGLRSLIRVARNDAEQVASSANALANNSEQIAVASSNQAQASAAVAAAIEELTTSIAVVAENAASVQRDAAGAQNEADGGEKLAQQAAGEIGRIAEALSQANSAIDALNARSDEIGGIVRVIKEIADQTNLLALNAAIEAARAGEMGRGFAVVADEVRKLAERTTAATVDISEKINTVQHDTVSAHDRMTEAQARIDSGVACTQAVAEALNKIRAGAATTATALAEITEAVREQRSAATNIASNVETIAQMSEENHAAVASTNEFAQRLGALSADLKEQIHRYIVD